MSEWSSDVAFIAEVMPDWTTLQLPSGQAFGFNRETGRVYRLPHPDCPFVIIGHTPEATRSGEGVVERVARAIYAADPDQVGSWEDEHEYLHNIYGAMARAALGARGEG